MSTNKQHDKDLEQIILHPDMIDINPSDIDIRMRETILYDGNRVLREPDGIFYDSKNHKLYIIEYKTAYSTRLIKKATTQLLATREILCRKLPILGTIDIELIIAYEKTKYMKVNK